MVFGCCNNPKGVSFAVIFPFVRFVLMVLALTLYFYKRKKKSYGGVSGAKRKQNQVCLLDALPVFGIRVAVRWVNLIGMGYEFIL